MAGNEIKQPREPNGRFLSPINGAPLPKGTPFTKDDDRASKAGKKSGERRTQRKTLREELLDLLAVQVKNKNGKKMKTQAAISSSLIKQALNGSTRAYEIIRDTIGEKPVENVNIVSADFSALDSAFEHLAGDDD